MLRRSMIERPLVTIAIPCLDEEAHIETCIATIAAQDYPKNRMEILVADGGSKDRTLEILRRLAEEDRRIHVLHNEGRIQAAGLNKILRRAKGDVVVRMDVHCEYAKDYVSKCVEVLERTGADNVGGAQRMKTRTWFQRVLRAAFESPLGVGGAAYRSADREGPVDTVFLGAFRRAVFEKVGLFDPGAVTNEDAELNQRILKAGGRVILSREIIVHYYPRQSLDALAKQYFRYGRGRARTLLKTRELPSLRPVFPLALVVGGAAMLVTWPWNPLSPLAFGAYALATGAEAVRVGRKEGWKAVPVVWAIFPTLHVSHGLGFAAGLLKYGLHPDWTEPEVLPTRLHVVAANV
jgi:succinoglycan biosynthesis protein ExoA